MRRTRLSLFYLAGYLLPTGVLLLVAPDLSLRLLLSNGDYGSDVFLRVAGLLLLAIGIIVVQIIRLRAEVLYSTTLIGARRVRGRFSRFLLVHPRPAVSRHPGGGWRRSRAHLDQLLVGPARAARRLIRCISCRGGGHHIRFLSWILRCQECMAGGHQVRQDEGAQDAGCCDSADRTTSCPPPGLACLAKPFTRLSSS